jgi:hypothetical protein
LGSGYILIKENKYIYLLRFTRHITINMSPGAPDTQDEEYDDDLIYGSEKEKEQFAVREIHNVKRTQTLLELEKQTLNDKQEPNSSVPSCNEPWLGRGMIDLIGEIVVELTGMDWIS